MARLLVSFAHALCTNPLFGVLLCSGARLGSFWEWVAGMTYPSSSTISLLNGKRLAGSRGCGRWSCSSISFIGRWRNG